MRTLIELCLSTVTKQLGLVDFALSTLNEELKQRLLENLIKEGTINDNKFTILLQATKDLENLDISNCVLKQETLVKLGEFCPYLKMLNLENCPGLSADTLCAIISKCPSLDRLILNEIGSVNSDCLKVISETCSKLQHLSLKRCKNLNSRPMVDDGGLILVASKCTNLTYLDLKEMSRITDTSISVLANCCRKLRYLSLKNCGLPSTESISKVVSLCTELRVLNLKNCFKLTDSAFIPHFNCPNLIKLNLDFCSPVTTASLEYISKVATSLREINVQYIDLSGNLNSVFERLSLTKIHLFNDVNLFDNNTLKSIGTHCPNLQKIFLGANDRSEELCSNITDEGIEFLASKCNRIYRLNISQLNITDKTLERVLKNNPIKILSMRICPNITDLGLEYISKSAPLLETFSALETSSLSNNAIALLANNRNLREIRLTNCDDAAILAITSACSIEVAILVGCQITNASVKYLLSNPKVRELDFSYCKLLNRETITAIANTKPRNLKKLSLQGLVWVSSPIVTTIVDSCPSLTHLFLAECYLVANIQITNPHLKIFTSHSVLTAPVDKMIK